ncbi:hypothetical protein RIF29_31966 [Crotalaria pallida]|uniref:Uncharacterized protein n=1 Tax=Crotalaria pallida TaxID=3830 RepID=A0AAN9HVJ1_CROPI
MADINFQLSMLQFFISTTTLYLLASSLSHSLYQHSFPHFPQVTKQRRKSRAGKTPPNSRREVFKQGKAPSKEFVSMSGENDPSALKTPETKMQNRSSSLTDKQDDTCGLSQMQTPQFSTTKEIARRKQNKQD